MLLKKYLVKEEIKVGTVSLAASYTESGDQEDQG
jgi:hypothetical protein